MKKIYFILVFIAIQNVSFSFANEKEKKSNLKAIENKGQWDENILYKVDLNCGNLFLEQNSFTYNFIKDEDLLKIKENHHHKSSEEINIHQHAIKVNFLGSNRFCKVSGNKPHETNYNYFLGNDPNKWSGGNKAFSTIQYKNLYQNIDMNVYEQNGNLKYDFFVAPNTNTSQIKIQYQGYETIELKDGNIIISTSFNEITEQKPIAYQIVNNEKIIIPCEFILNNKNEISFLFPDGYDKNIELIIDPVLVFSTYSGSTGDNWGNSATYDKYGNAYSGGIAFLQTGGGIGAYIGYPVTAGAYQTVYAGGISDMAISKYSPDGTTLLYATYIGGNGNENPMSLMVNNKDELVILGNTNSTNYPTTTSAFDRILNGGSTNSYDIIITILSPNGTSLIGSSYIGGSADDGNNTLNYFYGDHYRSEVIVDSLDNIYVASNSSSTNFPITGGAFGLLKRSNQDAVVFKMNDNVSSMLWSGYLGGSGIDQASGIFIDNTNNVYVCGVTCSNDFPVTSGALHTSFSGGLNTKGVLKNIYSSDGYITKIAFDGSSILSSTYLQSIDNKYDNAYLINLDEEGNVYVYGVSEGTYPSTAGVFFNGNSAQFIHKLTNDLDSTLFSGTFGNGVNAGLLTPTAFMVDNCHRIYVAGWGGILSYENAASNISNFPITSDAYKLATSDGEDFYLAVFDRDMASLNYATYFGESLGQAAGLEHVDGGTSRFSKEGVVYQAACASCEGNSSNFPNTPNVYSNTNNSTNCNAAVFKMEFAQKIVKSEIDNLQNINLFCEGGIVLFENLSVNANHYEWFFGDGDSLITLSKNSVSHTYSDTGNYVVKLVSYNDGDCFIKPIDSAFYNVSIVNPYLEVEAGISSPEDTICNEKPSILNNLSTNATYFQWYFGDGDSLITPIFGTINHLYSDTGVYNIMLISSNDGECFIKPTDTAYYTISLIAPYLNVKAGIFTLKDTICPETMVEFENISINSTDNLWIVNQFGTNIYRMTDSTFYHFFKTEGSYLVSLVASNLDGICYDTLSDTAKVLITVTRPFTFAGNDTSIFECNQSELHGCCGVSYLWSPEESLSNTNSKNTVFIGEKSTEIYLQTIDSVGCIGYDTLYIEVLEKLPVIPNIFTPNKDEMNDFFTVTDVCVTYQFTLFNRWGKQVYQDLECDNNFDGADFPDGLYYYLIIIKEEEYKGWVQIVR